MMKQMTLAQRRDLILLFTVACFGAGYASIGLVVLLLITPVEVWSRSWRWIPTALDRPLLAVLLVALASAIVSPWRAQALPPTILLLLTAPVAVRSVALYIGRDQGRATRLALVWIAGAVLAAVWWMARSWPATFIFAWTGRPGQNAIGTTLALSLTLALGMLAGLPPRTRWWGIGGILVILAGLVVTWARAAWLGAAAGIVTLVLIGSHRPVRVGLVAATAALIAAGWAASPHWPGIQRVVHSLDSLEANQNRLTIWRAVPRIVADYPILGTGYGTFITVYPRYMEPGARGPTPSFAHDVFLNSAAETGLLGLAAVISLWAAGLAATWRWRRRSLPGSNTQALSAAILAATVTLLTNQLFDGTVMSVQIGFGFFALLTLGAVGDRYLGGSPAGRA
jgi:O-antigen ligase